MMKSALFFTLLLAGMTPCLQVHADAATELSQAMESRRSELQLPLRERPANAPHQHFQQEREARLFLAKHEQELLNLGSAGFKKLSLNSPLLQAAYIEMFSAFTSCGTGSAPPGWLQMAREDLQRRGDAATPFLLDYMLASSDTNFCEELFLNIAEFPSISLAPYLSAARSCLQPLRPGTSERTLSTFSSFMSRHGTAEDMKILHKLQEQLSASRNSTQPIPSQIVRIN